MELILNRISSRSALTEDLGEICSRSSASETMVDNRELRERGKLKEIKLITKVNISVIGFYQIVIPFNLPDHLLDAKQVP